MDVEEGASAALITLLAKKISGLPVRTCGRALSQMSNEVPFKIIFQESYPICGSWSL